MLNTNELRGSILDETAAAVKCMHLCLILHYNELTFAEPEECVSQKAQI